MEHSVRLAVSKVLLGMRTLVTVFDGLDSVSIDEVTSDPEMNKLILDVLHSVSPCALEYSLIERLPDPGSCHLYVVM